MDLVVNELTLRPLEVLVHPGLLGLRFWDVAAGDFVRDGLRVQARDSRHRAVHAIQNRSGVWLFPHLPGILSADVVAQFATAPDSPPTARPYTITVSDPLGRFLPTEFDVMAPAPDGLFDWPLGDFAVPAGSPPQVQPNPVPLFSTASRPAPPARKVVYANLREFTSARPAGSPAPWALLEIEVDGTDGPESFFGLADHNGMAAVFLPAPPIPSDGSRLPAAQRSWTVRLRVYYAPAITASGSPPELPATEPPRLEAIFAQRSAGPAQAFAAVSPPEDLTDAILHFAQPLILQTRDNGLRPEERSFLFIQPAP